MEEALKRHGPDETEKLLMPDESPLERIRIETEAKQPATIWTGTIRADRNTFAFSL